MTNNCQHFVRDILTIFAFNASKYLSTQFHHRVVEGIIFPSLPLVDEIDEQKRMKEVKSSLMIEFKKYHQYIPTQQNDDHESKQNNDDNKEDDEDEDKQNKKIIHDNRPSIYDFKPNKENSIVEEDNNENDGDDEEQKNDEFDDGIPDINEEEYENELTRERFKTWLCDELGMSQYLEKFELQNVNQMQFIQYFDKNVVINNVGIDNKVHAQFIIDQAKVFDVNNNGDNKVNIYQSEFKKWLIDDVGLDKYLNRFQEKNMNDIRMIKYFDEEILKEIGVNLTPHCKLIIEHANKYKKINE